MRKRTASLYTGKPCKYCGCTLRNDKTRRCVDYHIHNPRTSQAVQQARLRNELSSEDLDMCRALIADGLPVSQVATKFEVTAYSLRCQLGLIGGQLDAEIAQSLSSLRARECA